MSLLANNQASYSRWIVWLSAVGLCGLGAFIVLTSVLVARYASSNETRPAGAIIVLGAAEYVGKPSPVYRARLDHAYDLYQQGIAPLIVTTGGGGGDLKYTEGGVGRDYLIKRGVPDSSLIAETQSDDTADSARRTANILRANGIRDCVAVSDAYHIYRVKLFLGSQGIKVYGSPRPNSAPRTHWARVKAVVRESLSLLLWRLHLT